VHIQPEPPAYRDLSDWVVLRVLESIRTGTIRPGERLVEHEVATRFGVSRAPVRDAFHKLQNIGVVERVRPRGVSVRSWTDEDAAEVYLLMDTFILMSVQLAVPKLKAEDLDALQASLAEARNALAAGTLDGPSQLAIDLRFHSIITRATGNRRLAELMNALTLPLGLYGGLEYDHLEPAFWLRIHTDLFENLKRGDVDGAVLCVLRNARQSEAMFFRALKEGHRTDQQGRRTDQQDHRTDQQGRRTDQQGHRTDQEGHRTDQPETGRPVDAKQAAPGPRPPKPSGSTRRRSATSRKVA
jgi:DNA-binding GntR family transcriptional regulator